MYRLEARKIAEDDDGHWINVQVKTTLCSYIVTLRPYDGQARIVGPGISHSVDLKAEPDAIQIDHEKYAAWAVVQSEMEE